MSEYENAVIYRISCKDKNITDCYIGSTTNLKRRIWKHRSDCHFQFANAYNRNCYKKMREHGGIKNWNIEQISTEKCSNKKELLSLERKYYEAQENPSLNTHYPGRSRQESHARWRANNPDYMATYREDNAEKIKKANSEYYKKNKLAINSYGGERIECEHCGATMRRNNIYRHYKSKKCLAIQKTSSETPESP